MLPIMETMQKIQHTRKNHSIHSTGRQTGTTPVTSESAATIVSSTVVENCSRSPVFGSSRKTAKDKYVSTMFSMMILMLYCFSARCSSMPNSTYGHPSGSGQHENLPTPRVTRVSTTLYSLSMAEDRVVDGARAKCRHVLNRAGEGPASKRIVHDAVEREVAQPRQPTHRRHFPGRDQYVVPLAYTITSFWESA